MRKHTVSEVMTTEVVTVREHSGYRHVVEALATHRISAVPVLDDHGNVVGVVSEADLLHKVEFAGAEPHVGLLEGKRTRSSRTKADSDSAAELMTAPPVTIGQTDSIARAARLMDAKRVKRLPVVDATGRLVGIVSRADLLRPFLRSDRDIYHEIRDEVILRTLWIDPAAITITVDEGIVTLHGEVERAGQATLVVDLVRGVAGVVDVVARLTSQVDDGAPTAARPPVSIVA